MSHYKNKETVLQFYRAFDNRNIDKAFALLADNFVAHMAGISEPLNKQKFEQFGREFYSAFINGQHTFEEIVTERDLGEAEALRDRIVTYGKFTAKHLGTFQGLPATNKQIEISVMHIDRVENGKIVEHWGQGDVQGLMKQLGIIFLPSPKLIFQIITNNTARLFKQ